MVSGGLRLLTSVQCLHLMNAFTALRSSVFGTALASATRGGKFGRTLRQTRANIGPKRMGVKYNKGKGAGLEGRLTNKGL